MRVKICGITNKEDALHAISCGADALGFVFYEKSPRYIAPDKAKEIIDSLPPFVEKVGLFVNESNETIRNIYETTGISRVQLHFDISQVEFDTLHIPTLRVLRVQESDDVQKFKDYYKLVDVHSPDFGGTGERLNLEWFKNVDCSKMILAGGLTPKNVHEAKAYGFYGVDVSSGVEKSKGKKDLKKVEEFIKNAKSFY